MGFVGVIIGTLVGGVVAFFVMPILQGGHAWVTVLCLIFGAGFGALADFMRDKPSD